MQYRHGRQVFEFVVHSCSERRVRGLLVLLLFACLPACQASLVDSSARDKVGAALVQAQEAMAEQEAFTESIDDSSQAIDQLNRSIMSDIEDKISKSLAQKFDISVVDMPASEFFLGLVADTNINVILHSEVAGEVTITLKSVTLDQVMQAVEAVYGYHIEKTNYGYHVYPFQLRTVVYPLDYLNVKRVGTSSTSVNSGEISAGGSSGESELSKSSQIETETETNFWDELNDVLSIILGNQEGRSVVINAQSGTVVVKASPREHRTIRDFLQVAERNLKRQVIIEAKILEVELNDSYQSGINWGAFTRSGSGRSDTVTTGIFRDETFITTNTTTANAITANGRQIVSENEIQGIFSVAFELSDFKGLIELLKTQGEVHVLSSPRISTINNQKAVIKVGTDEFFVTEFTNNTTTAGDDVVTSPEFTLTPFFSGIALDVTPQIGDFEEVVLHIHPSVTEVTDQQKVINILSEQITLPLALSTIRESDSIVKAKSEQIIVIGGLLQTQTRDVSSKTPWLSDLPLIGRAFHQKKQTARKSELVILLKPIVADPPDWLDLMPGEDGFLLGNQDR